MAVQKKEYPLHPTTEQISEWKATYGHYYRLVKPAEFEYKKNEAGEEVEVETEPEAVCYLKPPSRKDLSYAQRAQQVGGSMKFNEVLLDACFLGGDPRFKTNDVWFISIGGQLAEIIEIKETYLEKL